MGWFGRWVIGRSSPARRCEEKIYGRGYIYTGGDEISQKLVDLGQPNLQPGGAAQGFGGRPPGHVRGTSGKEWLQDSPRKTGINN